VNEITGRFLLTQIPKLLTAEEAAAAIGVTSGTLAIWRCTRRYPLPWIKAGRKVRYREDDVAAFLDSRRIEINPDDESKQSRARR
jgi:Helix-turn-helix domain